MDARRLKCSEVSIPLVNYADDFVILSSGKAKEALDWTRKMVTRLGLTLNEIRLAAS
jgi:RNA-directed DNA polymerase